MKFILPQNICSIISTLGENGFSAHIVGGCVRDMLTGKPPHDWDITTGAAPDDVKKLFAVTYDTGLKHGTVTVKSGDFRVEVTTWRNEKGYSDHRRPDDITFAASLTEDLARRDFTMNAIAYNPRQGIVDPFHGQDDIKAKLIRCVGDPLERFSEDALRMLRCIRFSAQLDFGIDARAFEAIRILAGDLSYISMERIQSEINKILDSPAPEKLSLLWETGLSGTVFPGLPAPSENWGLLSRILSECGADKPDLLALLFLLSSGGDSANLARAHLTRLKYDKATIRAVTNILMCLEYLKRYSLKSYSARNIRHLVSEYGEDAARSCLRIREAQNVQNSLGDTAEKIAEKAAEDQNLRSFGLNITGTDLENAGYCHGKSIGTVLSLLLLCVCERPELNGTDSLMRLAEAINSRIKPRMES